VDCRPVADTNRDGSVDEADTCVPIGGFINGLRPVNLAAPLIEAARRGERYVAGLSPGGRASGTFDAEAALFQSLVFAQGVTEDDRPDQAGIALPAGSERVCAFWDYEGMRDGVTWSAYWFVNGELSEGGSIVDSTWSGGGSGNWWVCMFEEAGLEEGLYELALEVEGKTLASDSIFLGGDRVIITLTFENHLDLPVCYLQLSPSGAQNWGEDELGREEILEPGASRAFQLASGVYDLRALDCDQQTLVEVYDLEFFEDSHYAAGG
jgi:hypothetical protein